MNLLHIGPLSPHVHSVRRLFDNYGGQDLMQEHILPGESGPTPGRQAPRPAGQTQRAKGNATMDGVSYDPTAWSKHCSVPCLQGSYDGLGWTGPDAYRQAIADVVTDALHEAAAGHRRPRDLEFETVSVRVDKEFQAEEIKHGLIAGISAFVQGKIPHQEIIEYLSFGLGGDIELAEKRLLRVVLMHGEELQRLSEELYDNGLRVAGKL